MLHPACLEAEHTERLHTVLLPMAASERTETNGDHCVLRCADVLLYAAQYDDVPCVINLAARYELQKGVLERLGADVLRQLEQQGEVSG